MRRAANEYRRAPIADQPHPRAGAARERRYCLWAGNFPPRPQEPVRMLPACTRRRGTTPPRFSFSREQLQQQQEQFASSWSFWLRYELLANMAPMLFCPRRSPFSLHDPPLTHALRRVRTSCIGRGKAININSPRKVCASRACCNEQHLAAHRELVVRMQRRDIESHSGCVNTVMKSMEPSFSRVVSTKMDRSTFLILPSNAISICTVAYCF